MTPSISVIGLRARQLPDLARALPRASPYLPLLGVMGLGTSIVAQALARGEDPRLLLRIGTALVAATAAGLLDDAAAVTVAAAPTTLAARRAVRASAGLCAVAVWYVLAASLARAFHPEVPQAEGLLEAVALTLFGFAVAAVSLKLSDDGLGGAAASVGTMVCFGTAFLPPRWWLPVPADVEGSYAFARLMLLAMLAAAVLSCASMDPARRPHVRGFRHDSRH